MVALRCRQGALLSIARITRTMARTPSCLHKRILTSCKRWSKSLQGLAQTTDDSTEWGSYLGKGPAYWASLPPWEANAEVDAALRQTRRALNGRKSTERRLRFLEVKTQRHEKRLAGKHLSELKSLLGESSSGSMLDVLEEQGQRITDPHCIATHTTEFFHEWHKAKDISYGFHKPNADIARLLNDKAYFHAEHETTGIPSHLLDKIWDSLNAPTDTLRSHSPQVQAFHTIMDKPPTLTEFRTALHYSKRQSSAGMSGVTYNLMSLWPTMVIEHVYDLLCAIWTHKSTPPFWKWR